MNENGQGARPDAVIIGGGPAGSTAAALLASWGRSVVLVHHQSDQPSLAESLPSSAQKLLAFVGQLDAVNAARFHPNDGNVSRWAGKDARPPTSERGYHIARDRFDRVLREHATSMGAAIVDGVVNHVALSATIAVGSTGPRGAVRYEPRFVLDCSGRAGVIARRGLRRAGGGYRTLAIAADWDCPDWPAPERTHTFVESYQNGWAWSVPLSPTRRQCTVMVDRDFTTIRKADLADLYRTELRKATIIDRRLAHALPARAPWACDASLYTCSRAAESGALLVGDAASFIEPLSSAGVKKALASAWRAAVVVNTAIEKPSMLGVASDFHARREHQVYEECLRRSASFFKSAANHYDDPFWSVRAASTDDEQTGVTASDTDLASDPALRQTFARLRDTPRFHVVQSSELVFDRAPGIEGRQIVLQEAVAVPGIAEPLRYAFGVNLPALLRIAPDVADVAALINVYESRVAAIDPRNLLAAFALLLTKQLLQSREDRR